MFPFIYWFLLIFVYLCLYYDLTFICIWYWFLTCGLFYCTEVLCMYDPRLVSILYVCMWVILIPNEYIFWLMLNSYVCRIRQLFQNRIFCWYCHHRPGLRISVRQGHVSPWSVRRPLACQRPEGTITTSQDKAVSTGTIFLHKNRTTYLSCA